MLITEQFLIDHGFKKIDYGDTPPYEAYEKHGIEIFNMNRLFWYSTALDQGGLQVEFMRIDELYDFFKGCKRNLYS